MKYSFFSHTGWEMSFPGAVYSEKEQWRADNIFIYISAVNAGEILHYLIDVYWMLAKNNHQMVTDDKITPIQSGEFQSFAIAWEMVSVKLGQKWRESWGAIKAMQILLCSTKN